MLSYFISGGQKKKINAFNFNISCVIQINMHLKIFRKILKSICLIILQKGKMQHFSSKVLKKIQHSRENMVRLQRKYGVVVLGGITRSESGTARNSFGSRVFTSLKTIMEAMLPQR